MPENYPLKRAKENGFCSRVSIIATGRGVRSWVPPRSGTTGRTGGATGAAVSHHSSGEVISVRRLRMARLREPFSSIAARKHGTLVVADLADRQPVADAAYRKTASKVASDNASEAIITPPTLKRGWLVTRISALTFALGVVFGSAPHRYGVSCTIET
jgi:hypothetical protein